MITELVTDEERWRKIVGTDDVPCPTEKEVQQQKDVFVMGKGHRAEAARD